MQKQIVRRFSVEDPAGIMIDPVFRILDIAFGRSRVFYCDSSAPYQKGSCEVRHEMNRRIIPKHTDITPYSQEQISLMV
jgi:IS30 family transposase